MRDTLRRRAEELVKANEATIERALSPNETLETLHELRVHQAELEIQNEELRRAQAELEAVRARYFDLYDLAPVGYCTLSDQGAILEANFTLATMLGVTRGALARQLLQRFILKEDHDLYYRHRNRLFKASTPQVFELRMVKDEGTIFWARLNAVLAHDADSTTLCRVVISDITERKQAESEVRRAQDYIRNILDSMPSVLIGVDPQGLVTHWNKAAEDIVGVTAGQALGRPLEEVFPRLFSLMETIRSAMRERKPRRIEREMFYAENERGYQDVMIYPLVSNGGEGAVVRVDDVTHRVQIEEMMVQSEKMVSVGSLAAGMAHEINNPLSGILQSAQVVISHLSPDVLANKVAAEASGCTMESIRTYAEKRKIFSFLEGIRESGLRAAHIVSNMLEFSRKSQSQHSSTDINTLLDKAVELAFYDYDLKKKYDFKQVHIVREYDLDLPEVSCTRTEIEQVILNLLKNATQAMALQENRATLPTIILRTARDGDGLRIEVEDNGPGMPESVRKRIFEPFFTTKLVGKGTGLGLSVSYFIVVTNHGGRFDVQSQPGKGTRFIMHLPFGVKNGS